MLGHNLTSVISRSRFGDVRAFVTGFGLSQGGFREGDKPVGPAHLCSSVSYLDFGKMDWGLNFQLVIDKKKEGHRSEF